MAFLSKTPKIDVNAQIKILRTQGLTDQQIVQELTGQGVKEPVVISALGSLNNAPTITQKNQGDNMNNMTNNPGEVPPQGMPQQGMSQQGMPPQQMQQGSQDPTMNNSQGVDSQENLYERIEEIAEGLIDEKWEDLISEVKKIIEWKQKTEETQIKIISDLDKLKEDFKVLHQSVLGKVEEYDKRMQDVGTELKAVGKVFKDVIPVFTENVKELRSITKSAKEGNN